MATRFGASSPAKAYQAKMRWLVGSLFAIIMLLVGLLYWFATRNSQTADTAVQNGAVASVVDASGPTVDILVAARRIEQGELVEEAMISTQPVPVNQVPEGTYRSHERPLLVSKWTSAGLNSNDPYLKGGISESQPLETIRIPPGYRAVTINVDQITGVEGWAKPNSRVDVLYTFQRNGSKEVATIVRFAKVLSVGGQTGNQGENGNKKGPANTATLLVTEDDAKKVEFARRTGVISLSLVGQHEEVGAEVGVKAMDLPTVLGEDRDVVEKTEEPADGVMYATDKRSGRKIRYLLRRGKWVRDPNY